jgi:hypothetical protein
VRVGIVGAAQIMELHPHPEIWPWFFGLWLMLGIASVWFMYLDKNIARKKRLLPVFIVGTGVIFIAFTFVIMGDLKAMALIVPAVALITFLNLRIIKICGACGKTIHSGMWFTKAEYCPKCGARLD